MHMILKTIVKDNLLVFCTDNSNKFTRTAWSIFSLKSRLAKTFCANFTRAVYCIVKEQELRSVLCIVYIVLCFKYCVCVNCLCCRHILVTTSTCSHVSIWFTTSYRQMSSLVVLCYLSSNPPLPVSILYSCECLIIIQL